MDERLSVIMYKDGLRPEIQAVLELHSSRTMSDAYKKALALRAARKEGLYSVRYGSWPISERAE